MASLKIRVQGGKMVICSVYAPHNGKPFQQRQHFFHDLSRFLGKISSHGPILLLGDFNSRLHRHFTGEENIIGPYVFGDRAAQYNPRCNRSLLMELCTTHKLAIGNTYFPEPAHRQITCYNVGAKASDDPVLSTFGQIDFILLSKTWLHQLRHVYSDRGRALASHHFLVVASLYAQVPKTNPKQKLSSRMLR